jgi:EmrB/QacA subfamily drug resistance transporter
MTLSPLRFRLLIASLLAVSFLGALDNTVVATAIATVAGQLGALEHMSWIVVGYTLASTVFLPIIGKLGDRVGPRAVFITSVIVFVSASVACGFASSFAWLVVARVVQGISSAGLQLMSQTITAEVTSPRERPKYLSIVGAAFPVAILIGPVLGGLITDNWGWPWVFWINAPVGIVALVLAIVAIPHIAPGRSARFDLGGSFALTIGLVSLVLAASWVGDGSQAIPSIVAVALGVAALVVFVVIERRVAEPLITFRLFANRTVWTGTIISAIVGIGLFSITAYLPTYFQMAYRTTATVSGLVPIATVFGLLISNLTTGWLASRTGHFRSYALVGTAVGAAGLATMAMLPAQAPLWAPAIVMAVVGLGTGSFMSLIVAVVQSAVPRSETGSITASINLVRQVGATIATALIGGVIGTSVAAMLPSGIDAATLTPAIAHAQSSAIQLQIASIYRNIYIPIFAALAGVYVVGIIAAILLPNGRLSDEHDVVPDYEPESVPAKEH